MGIGLEGRWAAAELPAVVSDHVRLYCWVRTHGPPVKSLRNAAGLAWRTWAQLPNGLTKLCGVFNLSHKELDVK